MTIGVIEVARNKNIDVPRDLSVVGFDHIRFARHNYPALTTIAEPMREIGEGTVGLLLKILSSRNSLRPASVTRPHNLIVRGTTGPARSRKG